MFLVTILVVIAMVATVAVLGVGIVSMAKGGPTDQQRSVQLMSARVALQATAIFLIILSALYTALQA